MAAQRLGGGAEVGLARRTWVGVSVVPRFVENEDCASMDKLKEYLLGSPHSRHGRLSLTISTKGDASMGPTR